MSISDEMMWRYYELLTDVQMADIEKMKRETHPMQAKKDLAARIVKDFYSAEAAAKAGEDWAKQFQKDEVPEDVETVDIHLASVIGLYRNPSTVGWSGEKSPHIRIDKLLRSAGLAASNTEALAKVRQRAVSIGGEDIDPHAREISVNAREFVLRVGRRIKKIRIIDPNDGN
jgi:tyrosyl-tRNA synthetase